MNELRDENENLKGKIVDLERKITKAKTFIKEKVII